MATKKNKKSSEKSLDDVVNELLDNVGEDRTRISKFLTELLTDYEGQAAGIAEYVAKIADALTKQNALLADTLKVVQKRDVAKEEQADEDFATDIGSPFEVEDQDEEQN